jgi:RNA polymerase sigma-70 factor (ECF subfamily)
MTAKTPFESRSRKKRAMTPEAGLVAELAAGKADALGQLYDRYSGMLLGLATKILADPADAEEVLQEVFLQVWKQAGRYDPGRSSVSTWMVLITRSRAIDRLRSRGVAERTAIAAESEKSTHHTSPEGVSNVFMQERRKRLAEELARLPQEQKQVLEMAFYQGLTQSEIAERTDTPLGTVKTRTLLAMRKLRKALQDEIEDLL